MNLLRFSTQHYRKPAGVVPAERALFRRFFDLMERLERPHWPPASKSAPEMKARITRLDDQTSRQS